MSTAVRDGIVQCSTAKARTRTDELFLHWSPVGFYMSVRQLIHQMWSRGIWDDSVLWLQLHHRWRCFSVGLGCSAVFGLYLDWCRIQHFGTIRNFPVYMCTILLPQFLVHFVVLHFVGEPIFSQCKYLAEPFFSLQICQVLGLYFVKDWWEWFFSLELFTWFSPMQMQMHFLSLCDPTNLNGAFTCCSHLLRVFWWYIPRAFWCYKMLEIFYVENKNGKNKPSKMNVFLR